MIPVTLAASGRPQKYGGRPPREPEPINEQIDRRQVQIFELHANGASYRQIQAQLGFSLETIAYDVQMETRRRANETAAEREVLIETSKFRLNRLIAGLTLDLEGARAAAFKTETVDGKVRRTMVDRQAADTASQFAKRLLEADRELAKRMGLEAKPDIPPVAAAGVPTGLMHPVVIFIQGITDPVERLRMLEELDRQARVAGVLPAPMKTVTGTAK